MGLSGLTRWGAPGAGYLGAVGMRLDWSLRVRAWKDAALGRRSYLLDSIERGSSVVGQADRASWLQLYIRDAGCPLGGSRAVEHGSPGQCSSKRPAVGFGPAFTTIGSMIEPG